MTDHTSTEGVRFPSDSRPTNMRNSHSRDADFAKNVTIIESVPQRRRSLNC